jgi:hypothetical protein
MGQIVNYINRKLDEQGFDLLLFEPYYTDPEYYYEYHYRYYLKNKLIRNDLFMMGFVNHLNCFQMENIISKYYCKNNLKQNDLIKDIEDSNYYVVSKKYHEYIDNLEEVSRKLSPGRYLLYLINLRLEFEKEIKKDQYLLKVCNETIESVMTTLDKKIVNCRNTIANEIAFIGDNQKHKFTSEEVICSYIIFNEKTADIYLEEALITGSFPKGLAFEILLDQWLIGDDNFLPNINVDNGVKIGKVNINNLKFQPITFLSYFHDFYLSKLIKPKDFNDEKYFKQCMFNLFNTINSEIKWKHINIFFESITQTGIKKYHKREYKKIQILLNRTLETAINRDLFLCTLSLIRDSFKNKSTFINILVEYFSPELNMGLETLKYFLHRITENKVTSKIEANWTFLEKTFPDEIKKFL